jgi:hypothetical protein
MSEPDQFQMCDVRVGVGLKTDETGAGTSYEVTEEGHLCTNEAVGKYRYETEHHCGEESWLCEGHRDAFDVTKDVTPEGWSA